MVRLLIKIMVIVLLLIAGLVAAVMYMASGVQSPRADTPPLVHLDDVTAETSTNTAQLKVVSWNIAWGYGRGSEGDGPPKDAAYFEDALEKMGTYLKAQKPDVVLLQEVDFDAHRSHGTNQARQLARMVGLPYVAEAESWTANYLPFPYWPPSHHFGRMHSGGAILSRYPIRTHRMELMPKPASNPFWYNLFYLFRYLQTVELDWNGQNVALYNMHLEAFDNENRVQQAYAIARQIKDKNLEWTIVGGDFNAVPAESTLKKDYPDEPETHHENDQTIRLFRGIPGLTDTIPEDVFKPDQAAYFTFPAHAPNRKLDFIFYGSAFTPVKTTVGKDAKDVSDHFPVITTLSVPTP